MIAANPNESVTTAAADGDEENSSASPTNAAAPDAERRHAMIAEAAFLLAEARGFEPGGELEDWLAAEREIDQQASGAPE